MPLAFESISHGTIAFGFFNIESDMLLLDKYFFFATDFCEAVCKMAEERDGTVIKFPFPAYVIKNLADIGDLHGGIAGTHYSGFIGETYKKYPFPKQQIDFKQQTEGYRSRGEFERMIQSFGKSIKMVLRNSSRKDQAIVGPYVFSLPGFLQLIEYVIRGGYPGWLGGIAPDYVVKMQHQHI